MDSTISMNGYRMDAHMTNVPVAFVNGIRRILLAEIPTVVLRDIQLVDNNTKMIHEMLRHRIEMLPINVKPEEISTIRDTRIELRYFEPRKDHVVITTDDFVVAGPRKEVFLKDRELNTPMFFMKLAPTETIHIKAGLGIEMRGGSHVCVATYKNHIDPELAKLDKDSWMAVGGNPKVFDNFQIQRSFARDEQGRPTSFDFTVESNGVVLAKDLFKQAVEIFKNKIEEWTKNPVLREEGEWYSIETEEEGHTLGALAQFLIYSAGVADFVSYRIVHPLLPKMIVRFSTKKTPELVIETFKKDALALCDRALAAL